MNLLTALFRNWKTTAAGIALLACTVMYLRGLVTLEQYLGAVGMLGGGGLIASARWEVGPRLYDVESAVGRIAQPVFREL